MNDKANEDAVQACMALAELHKGRADDCGELARALEASIRNLAQQGGEAVAQWRKVNCSDWYDGLPDHEDGGGPYETRTLYSHPATRHWGEPYGQITTHSVTGQQFFFRWPQPPYLDNASECVTVYTHPTPAAAPSPDAVPAGYRSGTFTTNGKGGATATFHFDIIYPAHEWFEKTTALLSVTPAPPAEPVQAKQGCSLGCTKVCQAKEHGCASECPALPWQPEAVVQGGQTRVIQPPEFAPMPSICDGMSAAEVWSYACLVGYRTKLSEYDLSAASPAPERVALTDEQAMRVMVNACDSLNITRVHEIGGRTRTICDEAGLLELFRAVEKCHGIGLPAAGRGEG
jgi:hypothetical protein